ncbi:ATP-binding protein [Arenicella xantha]|uniref:histidine kinase n=1 Tax=Arenicella xantha TaxID=644221 RepID=A0A395JMJ5_9GAMM|nr:ATP-binding protein [Arenicella xantha]RBP52874.1 phospho-acceptor domain-containing protein [Arenicella xantha]
MRKYIIILLGLGLIGIGLTVYFLTQEKKLDQTVYLQTTESIRNLQTLDKNLRLLLNQSRFNSQFDHHRLRDVNLELSAEFDNLRFEALFEEIESSQQLSETVTAFERAFTNRNELLEQYISANTQIIKNLLRVNTTAPVLMSNAELKEQSDLYDSIINAQSQLFSLTLGSGMIGELSLTEENPTQELLLATGRSLQRYRAAVLGIAELYPMADAQYQQLTSIETGDLLNQIESDYAAYHNDAIKSSNLLRNALVAYALLSLLVLVFFAYKIWRNYESLEHQVAERTEEIKKAYEELRESQQQLIQSEKMASLGQMVAGVAHEINTPLGYVTSNAGSLKLNLSELNTLLNKLHDLANDYTAQDQSAETIAAKLEELIEEERELEANELIEESQQLLNDGMFGLSEISKLVQSLKNFARLDRQSTENIDIHDCLDSSLTIASNPIKENDVTVVREFGTLPTIECAPSKLNQLFLNIITNACQAMHERQGSLTVRTEVENQEIRIDFIDQGGGMDEATQQKMFDPFFTTKDIGEGTGMGMSIAYKIIEEHNGRIEVSSQLNQGTTVSVFLPTT